MKQAPERGVQLGLPTDVVAASKFEADAESKVVQADQLPEGWTIMDIGPQTIEAYRQMLLPAKTVFWNGPMGVFEMPRFAAGTKAIADILAKLEATTVVGGGDSVAAVEQMGYADRMSHISTGGGASLEMIEGRPSPAWRPCRTSRDGMQC